MNQKEAQILELTKQLLDAIASADWEAYARLCDPKLTAFEPEAGGHLIEGMKFHRFLFESRAYGEVSTTMSSPRVTMLSDEVALITYIRLNQCKHAENEVQTNAYSESRLWQLRAEGWRHVHFHRSPA